MTVHNSAEGLESIGTSGKLQLEVSRENNCKYCDCQHSALNSLHFTTSPIDSIFRHTLRPTYTTPQLRQHQNTTHEQDGFVAAAEAG